MSDSEEMASRIDWTHIVVERRIAEAVDAGMFDNLPGKGKPIVLDDDPLTPLHLRIVNRVLKNARVVPTWISAEGEIELAKQDADQFRDQWFASRNRDSPEIADARSDYEALLRCANDLILKYNLVTPFVHRAPIPFRVKLRLTEWDDTMSLELSSENI